MKTSALYFNGSGSRVEIGNPAAVQITGDQTIELWLRPQVLGKRQNPFAKAYGGEGTITLEPNGALSYYHGVAGGNADPYQGFHTADGMIAPGRWNHLAVVRDLQARKLRWYVDGQQVMEADAAWGAAAASPLPLLLGQGYVEFFSGELCEVRLWASARSQAQIQQGMRRKLTGREDGLAGYWPLDEGGGTIAHDRSPAGNHGTMISGEWRATGPDLQPAFESLHLDGSNDYVLIGNPPSVQLTGDQTIELWLRPRVLGKRQNPFAKAYGGEGTITLEPDGSIGYYCGPNGYDTDPYADFHTPANVVPAGRWTHVAVTRQIGSKQLRWYCNGELVAEQTTWISGVGAGNQPLRIGKGYTNDFDGDIAEVRLWSTVRTQQQLRDDMNRRLT
ncbi:MAG: LamG domain-containing protein, partial [Myxococcales bacterium]|nr:LamG domain-containing protein [Myxococcales bacterium]